MNQYITSITIDGRECAGPTIEAESFADAESKIKGIGIVVLGQLDTMYQEPV